MSKSLSFTDAELETLRVALLSAHYSALDEERALSRRQVGLDPESAIYLRIEDDRAKAALRAHAYHLLVERVMAVQ